MTQEQQLVTLIVNELHRQKDARLFRPLYGSDDPKMFGVDGRINVVELAQVILKGQPDLMAALERLE